MDNPQLSPQSEQTEKESVAPQISRIPGLDHAILDIIGPVSRAVEEMDSMKQRMLAGALPVFARENLFREPHIDIIHDCTVFVMDISNYTGSSELISKVEKDESAKYVARFSDEIISRASEVVLRAGGDIFLFEGDAIKVVFKGEMHAQKACQAAREIQRLVQNDIKAFRTNMISTDFSELLLPSKDTSESDEGKETDKEKELTGEEKERESMESIVKAVEGHMMKPLNLDVLIDSQGKKMREDVLIIESHGHTYEVEIDLEQIGPYKFIRTYALPQHNTIKKKKPKFNASHIVIEYEHIDGNTFLKHRFLELKRKIKATLQTGTAYQVGVRTNNRLHFFLSGPVMDAVEETEESSQSGNVTISKSTFDHLIHNSGLTFMPANKDESAFIVEDQESENGFHGNQPEITTSTNNALQSYSLQQLRKCFEPSIAERISENKEGVVDYFHVDFFQIPEIKLLEENSGSEELLDAYTKVLEVVTSTVQAYGATLNKFTGSKGIIIFWPPQPNDKDRSRNCAKAMRRRLKAAGFVSYHGISCGPMYMGNVGIPGERSEVTAMGDAVNSAARLSKILMETEIMLPRETQKGGVEYMGHLFVDSENRGSIARSHKAKGKGDLLRSILQTDEEKVFNGDLVARKDEMTKITSFLADNEHTALAVLSKEGLGKSRMLFEARESAKKLGHVAISIDCDIADQNDSYAALKNILSKIFPPETTGSKNNFVKKHVVQMLRMACSEKHILITLDDIENIDPASWECLREIVMENIPGMKIMLALAESHRGQYQEMLSAISSITLTPLDDDSIVEIALQENDKKSLPENLKKALVFLAKGSPKRIKRILEEACRRNTVFEYDYKSKTYRVSKNVGHHVMTGTVENWIELLGVSPDDQIALLQRLEKLPQRQQEIFRLCALLPPGWKKEDFEFLTSIPASRLPRNNRDFTNYTKDDIAASLDALEASELLRRYEDMDGDHYELADDEYNSVDTIDSQAQSGEKKKINTSVHKHHPKGGTRMDVAKSLSHLGATSEFRHFAIAELLKKKISESPERDISLEIDLAKHCFQVSKNLSALKSPTQEEQTSIDTFKKEAIEINKKLATELIDINPTTADRLLENTINLIGETSDEGKKMRYERAATWYKKANTLMAKKSFEILLRIAQDQKNTSDEVRYLNAIGVCSNRSEAINLYMKTFIRSISIENPEYIMKGANNIIFQDILKGNHPVSLKRIEVPKIILQLARSDGYAFLREDEILSLGIWTLEIAKELSASKENHEFSKEFKEFVDTWKDKEKELAMKIIGILSQKEKLPETSTKTVFDLLCKNELEIYDSLGKLSEMSKLISRPDKEYPAGINIFEVSNRYSRASYWIKSGDYHRAIEIIEDKTKSRSYDRQQDVFSLKLLLIEALLLSGDIGGAEQNISEAMDLIQNMDLGKIHEQKLAFYIAYLKYKRGDFENIEGYLKKCKDYFSERQKTLTALVLIAQGKLEEAETLYGELLDRFSAMEKEGYVITGLPVYVYFKELKAKMTERNRSTSYFQRKATA